MRWIIVPLLLPLLVGCESHYTILEHHDINLPAGEKPTIVIEMANGPVTITTGPGKNIVGKLTKRGVGFDKEEAERELAAMEFELKPGDNGKIYIKARRIDKNRWHSSGAQAELTVPSGCGLVLLTSNAEVKVDGKAAAVVAKTSNALVTLKSVLGPVEVTTTNGSVRAEDVIGTAKIETKNGDVTVKGRQLNLLCSTSNGSIRFTGDVSNGEHRLTTSNGNITATLPQDCQLNVDANTTHGRITSDFKFAKGGVTSKKNQAKGRIGGEETDRFLVMKTSNSNISLKKGKSKDFTDVASE
jgi:DUF4097 and DUF4098 domain-containing protein YvlB